MIENIGIDKGFRKEIIRNKDRNKILNPFLNIREQERYYKMMQLKFNINFPIKPALNICQYIKSDRVKIDPLEMSSIYKIECTKIMKQGIRLSKRKIKEHKGGIRKGREKIAIAKITLNECININYGKMRKLANYNKNYAYHRESIEILSHEKKACNNMEYFTIDEEWQQLLQEDNMHDWRTGKKQNELGYQKTFQLKNLVESH